MSGYTATAQLQRTVNRLNKFVTLRMEFLILIDQRYLFQAYVPATRVGAHRRSIPERRRILKSQAYRVQRILEAGDELAVELEWIGILGVPMMSLPAGSEMKAFVAMFLTFRDGKIAFQRNYDCYPPFGHEAKPNVPA